MDHLVESEILVFVSKIGHVYILTAPEYFKKRGEKIPWMKVGKAVDVNKRMKEIKDQCGISDLKIVYDSQGKSHHLYWKI